jgi:hypothetical protein
MHLKATLLTSLLGFGLAAQPALAGLSCDGGYTHVTIAEGSTASTVNVSAVRQIGQICLTMSDDGGNTVFNDCGALIGNVTATDAAGNPTALSHTAVFELLESFKTQNDVPTILGVTGVDGSGTPCAFAVSEHMTDLKWGTGVFRGASIDATALGTLSFCPGSNRNNFVISGEACLRNR